MDLVEIPLAQLQPHPANSNVMPARLLNKLVVHLKKTGRYPPIIVRPWVEGPPLTRHEVSRQGDHSHGDQAIMDASNLGAQGVQDQGRDDDQIIEEPPPATHIRESGDVKESSWGISHQAVTSKRSSGTYDRKQRNPLASRREHLGHQTRGRNLADGGVNSAAFPPMGELENGLDCQSFQILDGHHRVSVLRKIGCPTARCVVWDVDDEEALLLLATLNRLQGDDDPHKRGALLEKLREKINPDELVRLMPEQSHQLESLLALARPLPNARVPQPLSQMPVAVHFFLTPGQRDLLERQLKQLSQRFNQSSREDTLMQAIEQAMPT